MEQALLSLVCAEAHLIFTTNQHRPCVTAETDARDKYLAPQPRGAHLKPNPRSPHTLGRTACWLPLLALPSGSDR